MFNIKRSPLAEAILLISVINGAFLFAFIISSINDA